MKYKINFQSTESKDRFTSNKKDLEKILKFISKDLNIKGKFEVSLNLFDSQKIKEINKEYRNIDKTTDVLSFPHMETFKGVTDLGDIFINYEILDKQASEIGSDADTELKFLFMHGLLHLVGHDHIVESDYQLMKAREIEIFYKVGIRKDIKVI